MRRKTNLLPFVVIAILFFLMNSYVLSGIHTLSTNPDITPIFWTFIILITASLAYAMQRMHDNGMDIFFKIATHSFLVLFVAELIFILILLPADVYRLFAGKPRNGYWVEFAAFLFILTILIFVYGIIKGKYAYRVIKHTLFFDDLPENFDGFTITQISDVHAGSFQNPKAVQRGIDLIKAQGSDLFVFTGDLVNNKAEEIKPWISYFSQIKAPFGQFSILGNHDYGDYIKWESESEKSANLQQLKKYHEELGFRLLLDEHAVLNKNGQQIILAGVENWGIGFGQRGDLNKALTNVSQGDFKILLSHDPTHWDEEVKKLPSKIDLTLSGHTHGMQFGIEAFGIKWSPVKYRYAHWAGIANENGRFLNINRGFGFLGFSGRIGIWPEITVIELKKSRK
ncbi:MAG: metallophosphoesterase [Candidatus Pedobacter colombiensis]|uniref:Metallophosphoesterase n=1 Tax=Candidatus Pedobacter colombiensis TaxID=3121371 RepID=A0AAJ5W618_9SPHI|nr:metallophosphoesterase [Pedobacter sp.]WEK18230.1 MAG: metallophosphoesterase [Pedobacter sp.]